VLSFVAIADHNIEDVVHIVSMLLALLMGAAQGGVLAGTRTGVITGQVRLPNGDPVSGIRVSAMEAPEMGNQDSAVSTLAGLTTTDATGHYRLEDIPVGKYFVVAGSLDNLSYYPGSITVSSVTPSEKVDFALTDSYDGAIDVTVHLSGSTTPVAANVVRIRSTSSSFARSLETNDKGVASFAGIPYGDYLVSTSTISIADALSGEGSNGNARELSVTITINPNRPRWAVSLGLFLRGTLQGKVRNENGTPAADISVSSMNAGYQEGRRILIAESSTKTNAMGEYQLPVSPGEHFIHAIADSGESYYPSIGDPANSKTVRVGNGETVRGFDIEMVRAHSLRGKILNLPQESLPPNFVLVSRNGSDALIPDVVTPVLNDGTFEIHGVPAGAWDLFAIVGAGVPELHQTGKVGFEVRDKDIEDLTISLQQYALRGKITGMGRELVTVKLVPIDSIDGTLQDAVPGVGFPATEGEFAFSNVPALPYRIEVNGLPVDWYVYDIRMGDASIFNDDRISVGTTPLAPLEIIVKSGAERFQGVVEQIPPNSKLTNARVVLVPDEPRRRNVLLYRTATIQSNGAFTVIPNPAPGSYKMFAVSNLPAGHAEWNAEFLMKYLDVAIPITVQPNQRIQTRVDLTPAR
jgi:carboxypeptidase family protein